MHESSTAHTYDRLSRWYDFLAVGERTLVEQGLRMLDVHKGEKVVDIGCGTGHALSLLAEAAGENQNVCGIDLSFGMLSRARSTLSANIPLMRANGLKLPFRAGSFDAVFISFMLESLPGEHIPRILHEIERVLKPDGRLGLVCMQSGAGFMVRLYQWAHRKWPAVLDCRPIEIRKWVEGSGWTIDQAITQKIWGLPVTILTARPA